jgi:hypothetical protein
VRRGVGGVVAARVAVAVRVGHARGKSGRRLAVRAGCSVAPATVAARVLGHLSCHTDRRKRGVMVGVEAVLFDLLAALILVALASLALPPQEDTSKHQQRDDDDGYDNSNGSLTARV